MYCYRRTGTTRATSRRYTQPLMYRRSASAVGARRLPRAAARSSATGSPARTPRHIETERAQKSSRRSSPKRAPGVRVLRRGRARGEGWAGYTGGADDDARIVPTGVPEERLRALLESPASRVPEASTLTRKLQAAAGRSPRARWPTGDKPIDWSAAEALALATLADRGHRVRLSGQDARGTFSHRPRHLPRRTEDVPERYSPAHLPEPDQARFEIWNSPLSEVGVLGFEYGYSLDRARRR